MQIEEVDAWLNCKPIPNLKINTEPNSVQELVSRDIINKGINNIKSLLTMGKAKLKPIEVEYIQWEDNLSEMKMFCKDNCKITYEYAVGIDCYWNLLIISDQQKWLTVPLHSYVIKLPDRFLVMNETEFKEYLDIINEKIPG